MKKKNVDYIHVSHYDELSVKKLWEQIKDDKAINVYFQDVFAKDRYPCREYFFNLLNTIYPDYLSQIMKHACKERFSAEGANMKT